MNQTDQSALELLKDSKIDFNAIVDEMRPIVREVKEKGDAAIKRFTKQFDKRELLSIAVPKKVGRLLKLQVSPTFKEALNVAKENIMKFHAEQLPKEWWVEILPGIQAGSWFAHLKESDVTFPEGDIRLSLRF